MLRIIRIELKRLFSNKLSLALAVLAPVISLLFLASLIAPLFFSNQRLSQMVVAVFQEETHPDAQVVIENVVASDQIQALVDVKFVDSVMEGVRKLKVVMLPSLFMFLPDLLTVYMTATRQRLAYGLVPNTILRQLS